MVVEFSQRDEQIRTTCFLREFVCARIKRLLAEEKKHSFSKTLTISFRRRASAASRLAGLWASRLSPELRPRLRSSWIMVFFTYSRSMSLHEPPLEFSSPLRLFGSGGRPSMQAIPPAVPFADLPFIVPVAHRVLETTENRTGVSRTSPRATHRATALASVRSRRPATPR